ncbi:MAG: hypothetical protein KA479_02980, partial [Saprospiraceae bacterium]|nr:hypothetical protein [Saprospiraceae bacterium]
MTIRFLFLVTFLLFIGNSCSRKSTTLSDPTTFNPYLASYTGSIISRVSPIVVTFTAPYGQDADAIKAPAAILEFAPAIQGKLEWRDPYSIQFTPEGPLPSGQDYIATLQLSKIVSGLPDSLQQFVFGFKTRDQFMRISLDDLTIPDESKPSSYQVSGKVLCSDFAEEKAIEKAITVQLPGTPPAISWNHDPGGMIHHFTLYPVVAGPTAESLTINWNGSSLGLENDGSEKIDIPSATDFRILRANVQQGNQSGLRISFSQLLDKDQDLTGLVYLSTLPEVIPQFIIEGNNLTCYFPSKLVGNHDLQISKGVKNRVGKSLNQPFTQKINFTQAQPGVRLVGSGNIMPHADQLYFPFEAMNLHTVDVEIFKIHKTNILQFLQVNQLDGDYETQRVGKIIWRGQVDLSSLNPERNNLEYVRYALDLAPLIEPDPEAIYQVRIGFWKEYSDFVCDETNTPLPNDSDDDEGEGYYEEESNPDEYSIMQAYYGREGYTPNFRWELRDDPCATEYYNSDRFVSRNVLSSNLGITCKQSESGDILIVATDLRTAKPVANAHVSFYDYQLQVIQTGKTNNQGIYLAKTRKSPEFVVVRLDQQTGYLVLKDYNTLTTSDFQTEGTAVKKGLRGFTYAERGVWRPGDSIFLNLVLYDPQKSLPVSYPITMEFIDPRGREVSKFVNTKPVGPIYPFAIVTSSDAPTGVWHARFKAGGATFSHYLRIETIKPNRYKLLLDFGKDRLRAKDEPFSASLKATWLHGAPAPYQEAQIEARALPIPTLFKGYESFIFDHPDRDFENQEFVWIKEKTNQDGILQIRNKPLLGKVNPPGKLKINLKYRVNEPGGGFSQDFRSIDYDPYASYCGISIPTNKDGEPVFDSNEKVTIRFASVSEDGKPNARKTLQVRLVRKEWRWWWERYRDNRTGYNESAFQEEDKSTVLTTNAKGIAEWSLQFDKYSRYFVEVCDAESGHCSGADIYIWSNAAGGSKDVKYFTFTTDKEEYKPGETVTVELPGAADGQALISLESGSNILSAQLISLGKNKSLHKFQVTPEMTPNIYIHIALLQPHSQLANDLPLRLYGIHPIKISDPTSKLDLIVNAPVEMRPDKAYTLQVSEKNSQPMAYTIALVDEGLLDLTRFKTPNPHEKLFSKEALGVKSWDMYDQVLGGFAGELKRIVSIGGDAAAARPDGNPKANRFKPAVVHLGPFKLAAGKKASHQI